MKLRKGVRILLWIAGSLAVAVGLLYLLRWPLFGGTVRSKVAALVSKELQAQLEIGGMGGSLLYGVNARALTLHPRKGAPFRSATVERVTVKYGFLGSGEPSIDVVGARFELASKEGPAPPLHHTIRDIVSILRSLRFPGTVHARQVELVLPDGQSVKLDRGMLDHGTWEVALRAEKFGTIEGSAALRSDGALTFVGKATEGPLREATLEMGPGTDRCTLKISTVVEGHPLTWTGHATFDQGQLDRVEGELAVKEGRATTRADLKTGRVETDIDAVFAVKQEGFEGDLAVTGRGEGPLAGPKEEWTVQQARVQTRGARFRSAKIDEAEVTLGPGSLSGVKFKGEARSGVDRVLAEGRFRWVDKPELDAGIDVAIADVAPYLPLLQEPPLPITCRRLQAEGKLLLRDGRVSCDAQVTAGEGSYEKLEWTGAVFKGSYDKDKIEAREVVITGTPFAKTLNASGSYDAGAVSLRFTADKDSGQIGGKLDPKTQDFEGRIRLEGPMAWLKGGFNLPVPEKIIPIVAEGKIRRVKDDLLVALDVTGQAGFSMALSATIRREQEDWIVAVAPGTIKLPERAVSYEAFVFSIARGKASLRDVRLTCTEPELAARINGQAAWDDKQLKVTFRMLDTRVKGKAIDPLVARLEVDWATGDIVPDLRWGREDGDHLRITGRWGKDLDLEVVLRAGDLKRPLVRDLVQVELEGAVAIDAHVTGTRDEPQVTGTLNLMKVSTGGMPPVSIVIPIQSSKNVVRLWSVAEKTPYGTLTIEGSVQLTGDVPVDLSLQLTTDDLSPLLNKMAPETRKWIPRGGLAAEVSVRGPALKLQLGGRAEFVAMRWRPPPPLGEALDIRVAARLDADGIQIEIADGLLGQGPFWASGRWDCFRPNTPLSLWITGSEALAIEDPLARLRVKPDVVLLWEAGRILKLSGRVEIPLAIYHREFGAATPGARQAREVTPPRLRLIPGETGGFIIPGIPGLEALELDLTFVTTGEFRIENGSLGVLVHAEGQLTGTAAEPALSGVARSLANRGEVKLAPGNFLHIDTFEVIFPGDLGRVPTVRFQGHTGAGEGMIQVVVDGPLESPSLVLRSDPPLPQKDLLARLAFGHVSGAVSGETGVATLALYVFDQTKDAWPSADRKEGFLDRLRPTVVPGDTSLQRRVPWELPPQGMTRSTSLRTEYVLNSVFSVVAETNREGDVGGDLKLRIRF